LLLMRKKNRGTFVYESACKIRRYLCVCERELSTEN
jgi:hypothetical protein